MCLFTVQIRYQMSLYVSGSLVTDYTDIVGVIPTTGLGGAWSAGVGVSVLSTFNQHSVGS